MKRGYIIFIFLSAIALISSSCRKDLCYNHDQHGLSPRIHITPDWEQEWERDYGMAWQDNWPEKHGIHYDSLRPSTPSGIAAYIYHEDGSRSERHLDAEGGEIHISEGEKSILLHNDDTRYIVFGDMEVSTTASATTRALSRSTYNRANEDEMTVNAPDMLYGAWIESYTAVPAPDADSLAITLRPLVYTYLIRYEFDEGLEHVTLARGALSGMALSVYLQDGRTSAESATILFDCELTDYGTEIQLTSFGLPDYESEHYTRQNSTTQNLNLEVMLKNGKLKTFNFDVSDQLSQQPRGGVITVSGLTVSDAEAGGDAAFDVNVDGWGEYEDIELPLN